MLPRNNLESHAVHFILRATRCMMDIDRPAILDSAAAKS
jgi:hypothetical protein